MNHCERNLGRVVAVSLLSAMCGCMAAPPPTEDREAGSLEVALATPANSEHPYRLTDATFAVAGPLPTSTTFTITTEDYAPNDTSLRMPLSEGVYEITLLSGWTMQRYDASADVWNEVEATLLVDTVSISVTKQHTSQAKFAFEVPEGMLDLGEGEIVIEVDENGECPEGFVDCGNGCVDLASSKSHCGACGKACGFPHASAECAAAVCELTACEAGFEDCDGDASNGCEKDTTQSPFNCGGCGIQCPYLQACVDSQCVAPSCTGSFANCDGSQANGCETDTSQSPFHCGACGNMCPSFRACINGSCTGPTCAAGTADCDGGGPNGCETELNSDANNCGACGVQCADSEACVAGACEPVACDAGTADCDQQGENGCEVNLNNDRNNCGACGNVCGRFLFWRLQCRAGVCTR